MIYAVYVKDEKANLTYTCQAVEWGWLCGKCGLGDFGHEPQKGKCCDNCNAAISEVSKICGLCHGKHYVVSILAGGVELAEPCACTR